MLDEKEPLASFENLRVEFDTKDGKVVAVEWRDMKQQGEPPCKRFEQNIWAHDVTMSYLPLYHSIKLF